MEITLEDAFQGKTAKIEIPVSVTCEACSSGYSRSCRWQCLDPANRNRGLKSCEAMKAFQKRRRYISAANRVLVLHVFAKSAANTP